MRFRGHGRSSGRRSGSSDPLQLQSGFSNQRRRRIIAAKARVPSPSLTADRKDAPRERRGTAPFRASAREHHRIQVSLRTEWCATQSEANESRLRSSVISLFYRESTGNLCFPRPKSPGHDGRKPQSSAISKSKFPARGTGNSANRIRDAVSVEQGFRTLRSA